MDLCYTEGPQWNYIDFLEDSHLTNFVVINLVSLKIIIKAQILDKEIKSEHKNKAVSLE